MTIQTVLDIILRMTLKNRNIGYWHHTQHTTYHSTYLHIHIKTVTLTLIVEKVCIVSS